jgi:hypothetical protein
MRNLLLAGTAGLLMVVGVARAASAYEANPNVPNWSPYSIMGFAGTSDGYANPGYGGNPGYPAGTQPMDEGRSAYVDPGYHRHRHVQPGYDYGADPDAQNMGYDSNRFPGFGDTGSQY